MRKTTRQILNIGHPEGRLLFMLSGPYPYELVESVRIVAGLMDGLLTTSPSSMDAIGLQSGFLDGSLSDALVSVSEKEAFGLSGGFNDGSVRVALISCPLDKEALGLSGGFNHGTLKVVLATNTMQTEAFGLSGGFNNGTLS